MYNIGSSHQRFRITPVIFGSRSTFRSKIKAIINRRKLAYRSRKHPQNPEPLYSRGIARGMSAHSAPPDTTPQANGVQLSEYHTPPQTSQLSVPMRSSSAPPYATWDVMRSHSSTRSASPRAPSIAPTIFEDVETSGTEEAEEGQGQGQEAAATAAEVATTPSTRVSDSLETTEKITHLTQIVNPAVTHETVHQHITHVTYPKVEREIHEYDAVSQIQPILEVEVLSPRHFIIVRDSEGNAEKVREVRKEDLPGEIGDSVAVKEALERAREEVDRFAEDKRKEEERRI